jgi:hypothetical protein
MAKTARLLVRYGKHAEGEVIRGALAADLIKKGMATDITPRARKRKAPAKKAHKAAPENKGAEFDPKG